MDWSQLSGILTGVLTVFAIITGALLGLQRGTMSNLRERADDLSKTAGDLRGRIGDLEQEITDIKTDNVEIHAENDLLKRLNSQSVNWTAVTDMVDHHHQAAEKHWENIHKRLGSIEAALAAAVQELGRQSRGETNA